MTGNDWIFSLADVVEKLPEEAPDTMRFHYALRHGTMKFGLYGPREIDTQTPHKQDELYVVASGSGYFRKNGARRRFSQNDVIFVEAGAEHRFEEFTADFLTWVIFWGPEGGEAATAANRVDLLTHDTNWSGSAAAEAQLLTEAVGFRPDRLSLCLPP